ncbi:MAG: E3 ubiquitin protein ligase, partial [Terriglobus roseus]|nr:E3 ubiquitin protein ligase [Terriglobus roseus]
MEAGEDRTWPSPQAPTPNQARGGLDGRQSEGRQEACVICLEPVTERAIAVPCNHHTFDFICLASWLSERSTCPLCNVRVTELQYDWRSPDDFQRYRVESTTEATRPSSRGRYVRWGRRRQPRPRPALPPPPSEDEAVVKRREVYRRHLYSLHVGANRVSRHRNFTPR